MITALLRIALAAGLICSAIVIGSPPASAADCNSDGATNGSVVIINGLCVKPGLHGSAASGPPTRTIACGSDNPICTSNGDQVRMCTYRGADGQLHLSAPFVTQTLVNGRWVTGPLWCPGDAVPALAAAAIREQAIRLLPRVTVAHAFRTAALVNTEEIFWADTPVTRPLSDVTIVGQTVELQVSLASVHWVFGDGTSDTTDGPGRPYDPDNPCTTAQCDGYYGHTYRAAGTMTVTAEITWNARFRLAGGAWTDIAEPITGPQTVEQLRVVESRAVLVPNSR